MYDELVKRLRASVDGRYEKCDGCPYEEDYPCCVDCLDKMHKQAADAIEELSADCDMYRKGMTDEHNKAARLLWDKEHCWIPVTERLPETPGEYMVAYHPCYWDRVHDEIKVGLDSFRGKTSWAKKKYKRVTHWMPLPEPPKEG